MILIAEDNALIALTIKDQLEDSGRQVVLARSAEEAFQIVDRAAPKAAVVDLELADGLTGKELAAALAQRDIPVIVLTGYPDASEHRDGLEFCRAVLTKPVEDECLLKVIDAALAEPAGRRTARPLPGSQNCTAGY